MKIKITTTVLLAILLFILSISPSFAASATLTLSPASGSYKIGDTFPVNVILNTDEGASGADVYLQFDPDKIILADIVPGSIFGQYVGEEVNNSNGTGSISGLASSTSALFAGTGTFAVFNFKAIDSGDTNVTITFTPGSSTDNNVAGFTSQSDILTSVNNASYNISGTSTGSTTTTTNNTSTGTNNTSTGTTTTNTTKGGQMPVSVSSSSTLIMTVVSLILIALGAITAKFSF